MFKYNTQLANIYALAKLAVSDHKQLDGRLQGLESRLDDLSNHTADEFAVLSVNVRHELEALRIAVSSLAQATQSLHHQVAMLQQSAANEDPKPKEAKEISVPKKADELLTTAEVAERTGLKPKQIRNMALAGRIQSIGPTRPTRRFPPSVVDQIREMAERHAQHRRSAATQRKA